MTNRSPHYRNGFEACSASPLDAPVALASSRSLSERELEVLLHTLGLNRQARSYRNHFCAGETHDDMPVITGLIERGLMKAGRRINGGRDGLFFATQAGLAIAKAGRAVSMLKDPQS